MSAYMKNNKVIFYVNRCADSLRLSASFVMFCFTLMLPVQAQSIDPSKSLMITEPAILNAINEEYNFAYTIGEFSNWLNVKHHERNILPGKMIVKLFNNMNANQGSYQDYFLAYGQYNGHSQGLPVESTRRMNRIYQWKSESELNSIQLDEIEQLKAAPFRLLAIANLATLAGDFDDRAFDIRDTIPRALGELHLVYGYVDQAYESANGKPYPQTFVTTFRIPGINQDRSFSALNYDTQYQMDLVHNPEAWQTQMKRWAEFWRELSDKDFSDEAYKSQLRSILELIVQPENFIAVRSNTKIADDEFEIRESYVNPNGGYVFVPRKIRNEAFDCIKRTENFKQMLRNFWDYSYHDLNVHTYATDKQSEVSFNKNLNQGEWTYSVIRDIVNMPFGQSSVEECGHQVSDTPFSMFPDNFAKFTAIPQFVRIREESEWKIEDVSEPQRHGAAIRSCSGCHSKEGAPIGGEHFAFHIAPRLTDEESQLSPFLTGSGANAYINNGIKYEYCELEKRKQFMLSVLSQEAKVFDGLKRDDRSYKNVVPGRIESEHFDHDIPGVAYFDSDTQNTHNAPIRTDTHVDVGEQGEMITVKKNTPGEWQRYTANVNAGSYRFKVRVSNGAKNNWTGRVNLLLGHPDVGGSVIASVEITTTGSYSHFELQESDDIVTFSNSGSVALYLQVEKGGFNIDYIEFVQSDI